VLIVPEEDDSVIDLRPVRVEGVPSSGPAVRLDFVNHLPDPIHKAFPMSTFGWIAAGHRLLHTPWPQRRGGLRSAAHKATVGLELLESISLLSHASLAIAHAHLEALRVRAKTNPATDLASLHPSASPIQAKAATQTQTVSQVVAVPATLTNFSQAFMPPVNLFDPKLGTLTEVKIVESATLTSNVVSQNTSTSSGADITAELNGNVSINGIGKPLSGMIQAFSQTISVPASTNGANDFLPPTTVVFPPLTGAQTQTLDLTDAADLATFTATSGHTTISPVLVANATSQATAPNGNLQTKVMTEGLGTISISYQYTPAVPQVIKVTRFGIHQQPTVLKVSFSGTVVPSEASNPANYLIVLPNRHGSFTGAGVTFIPVASATYDSTTNTATLLSSKKFNFHNLAELQVTLPSNNGKVLTAVFGGTKDLGGFQNPNNKSQFIPYIPGVTVLP
jgi:hypothetical protein